MKELQRRQKIKRAMYSLPAILLLLAVAFLLCRSTYGVVVKERESARHVRELKEQASALSLRSRELEARIARLNTEEGIEEEIKEKFSVALPDEHVAILVDENAQAKNVQEPEDGWFKKWWSSLSGLWR